MGRKVCASLICILWFIGIVVDENPREVLMCAAVEPVIGAVINMMVSLNYIDARGLKFEYIGRDELDREKAEEAEWSGVLDVSLYEKQWTFIADTEEEYQTEYAAYGMESELVKGFDFENNILLITINRPLSSVRIMERNTGWKDGKPYASAEFTYKKECEDDTVCFHSLPRVILKYKNRGGEIITSRLSLWKIRYDSRENPPNKVYQIQSVDYTEAARKWIWAFKYFNRSVPSDL